MNDLISVIMPAYNAESYISKAIESVLQQTYKN
ncbi:glycosyltransferase, partial [Ursidibacter maritimus]|nr:glycosyltransferase [Ursidibacter maritimus]